MSGAAKTRLVARLYRLVRGLARDRCPTDPTGHLCYWCTAVIKEEDGKYRGDYAWRHTRECPWLEVIDLLPFIRELEDGDRPPTDRTAGGAGGTGDGRG